jgi:hypothetical protein
MNKIIPAAFAALLGLAATGCASYAKYYNAQDEFQGSCKAGSTFLGIPLFPFGGHCYASANPIPVPVK